MKLVTYLQNGIEQIGVLTPAEDAVVPAGMLGLDFADMAELAVQMTMPSGTRRRLCCRKKPERESLWNR